LLSTIANSLYTAVSDDATREAAVISFVVAASGTSLFGIGAAFWGPVASGFANFVFIKKNNKWIFSTLIYPANRAWLSSPWSPLAVV
jgi:predicted benzoate:H+ symporter BenE